MKAHPKNKIEDNPDMQFTFLLERKRTAHFIIKVVVVAIAAILVLKTVYGA